MEEKLLIEISEEVKANNGSESYDTWGNPERSKKFIDLKFHLIDKKIYGFKVNDEIFIVEFIRSNGITSMGGTPDSIYVKTLVLL